MGTREMLARVRAGGAGPDRPQGPIQGRNRGDPPLPHDWCRKSVGQVSVRTAMRPDVLPAGVVSSWGRCLDGVPAVTVLITRRDGSKSVRGFKDGAAALMWVAEQEFLAANAMRSTHVWVAATSSEPSPGMMPQEAEQPRPGPSSD